MKPKFPNFTEFYDQVEVYTLSGTRTAQGGFTETETLNKTIWADVQVRSGNEFTDNEGGNRREFTKELRLKTYPGQVTEGQLIVYNSIKNYVYSVDRGNPAFDVISARQTK